MIKEVFDIAQEAQKRLERVNVPAEHIYLIDASASKDKVFVFISKDYDKLNLYDLAEISSYIQTNNGPLSNKFFLIGEEQLSYGTFGIKVTDLFLAKKLYGKKELDIEDRSNEDRVHRDSEQPINQ